ncbi:ribose-phosphate diphosphokinase [Rhodocyclaceae bacterium SMB388]
MPDTATLLHFDDERPFADRLAKAAALPAAGIVRHRFPDGELRLRLPAVLPETVVLLRSLVTPNEKLVEILLAARTVRDLGAQRVVLVAPYLAYMRQDIAFEPGEAVSQRIVGRFLSDLFDGVITVDPHLHRVATLAEAVPVRHAVALSAAGLLADLIAARRERPLLIGPDAESAQWVATAADAHGFDHAVCAKLRRGDHDVDIALPDIDVRDRAVVLLDDMVSTGNTVAVAARRLLAAGACSVDLAVTHALFAGGAFERLRAAGVGEVWSSDCIVHTSNAIGVAPLLADALRRLFGSWSSAA